MTTLPLDWPNRAYSRMVRVGSVEWHVQEAGVGPVLLLLHGTGAATHSWRDVLPIAAQHFRTIAIDLPGHGFTKGRGGGLSLPSVARQIAALLAALDVEPALVVGHSAGAAVAARLVLDGSIASQGIVAIAPALLPFPGIAQHLFPTMAKLLFVNPFAPQLFAAVARQPGAVERFLIESTGSKIDAAGVAAYARLFGSATHCAGALGMMANWDLAPLKAALPNLAIPVLILHGDGDSAIPVSAAHEAAALIPRAAIEVAPGRGHLLHEEVPGQTADRIVDFARQLSVLDAQENEG